MSAAKRVARTSVCLLTVIGVISVLPANAQSDLADVEVKVSEVGKGVWMLQGAGGNIGVSAGDDGIFLIDDQFAPLTEKIRAAVAGVHDGPIRFVLNTHWHPDHTGGNENLGKAGALIVAHDNVRKRMSTEQFFRAFKITSPASPEGSLPVVTFSDSVTFHINGDTIHAFLLPAGHTDGDVAVHFREANVMHVGDLYFSGRYPLIDVGAAGSVDGMIEGAERVLTMIDDETRLIPGHGPVTGREGLRVYRDMLRTVRDRVAAMIAEGKSGEEIIAAKPTADLDERWGTGGIKADKFVEVVHDSLTYDPSGSE